MSRTPFQDAAPFLREVARPALEASPEYRSRVGPFDGLLVLADRLLAACEGQGRVAEVGNKLVALARAAPFAQQGAAIALLCQIEAWLKAIVELARPDRHDELTAREERRRRALAAGGPAARAAPAGATFDLNQAALELDLLPAAGQSDPVRQQVQAAVAYRDDRVPGAPPDLAAGARLAATAAVPLLAAVARHQVALRAELARIVVRLPDLKGLEGLARAVEGDRQTHARSFVGRSDLLTALREALDEVARAGGHVLVTGPEGVGLSALVARLSADLAEPGAVLGAGREGAAGTAPWLPGVLLHLGEHSCDPTEVTRFLLAQAGALLLGPLALPTTAPPRHDLPDHEADLPPADQALVAARPTADGDALAGLRQRLEVALGRLAAERGRAVVLIDAADDRDADGPGLAYLPAGLPPGVAVLVTARAGGPAAEWLGANRPPVRRIEVGGVPRAEAPLFTGVPDDADDGRRFNDAAHGPTGGLPALLTGARRQAEAAGGYRGVTPAATPDELFRHQAQAWGAGPLPEVLALLALFEPCAPLTLAQVQGYVRARGGRLYLPQLRAGLRPVAFQLSGLDADRVKLASGAFARFVRETHLSPADRAARLEAVAGWLAADADAPAATAAAFLRHGEPGPLLERLEGRGDRLIALAEELERVGDRSPLGPECLRRAATAGDPRAMTALGEALLEGRGADPDPGAGRAYLERAAEAGAAPAQALLGERLVDGRGLPAEPGVGRVWLKRAAEAGHAGAMRTLGLRLLDGRPLAQDPAAGRAWLTRAAGAADPRAMCVLGARLLDGLTVPADPVAGRTWLARAAGVGDVAAMLILGDRLVTGRGLPADPLAGRAWLTRAATALGQAAGSSG